MTEVRRQESDDYLHFQSMPQTNRAEYSDLTSVLCPLFSVIWSLTPETLQPASTLNPTRLSPSQAEPLASEPKHTCTAINGVVKKVVYTILKLLLNN